MEKKENFTARICDFVLWNFDSENFGLIFPTFSFFGAK